MNRLSRAVLFVYAFCLALISVLIMLAAVKKSILRGFYYWADSALSSKAGALLVFLIALLFFAVSIFIIVTGFKSKRYKLSVKKQTDIGEVGISLDTLENIAISAVGKVQGITDTKAQVVKNEENVEITVRAKVVSGMNIPVLSEQVQREVKQTVEESSGVNVNAVKVFIENISSQESYRIKTE